MKTEISFLPNTILSFIKKSLCIRKYQWARLASFSEIVNNPTQTENIYRNLLFWAQINIFRYQKILFWAQNIFFDIYEYYVWAQNIVF